MRALILVMVLAAILFVACARAPAEQAMAEKPSVAEPSLAQEISTVESADTDVSLAELDQLEQDLAGVQI